MIKTLACVAFFALGSALAVAACSSSSNNGTTGPEDAGSDVLQTGDTGGGEAGPTDAGLQPLNWGWMNIPGAKCRDGSDTGIAVNLNPASTKVMIFLEGGGACFNSTTCGGNPSKYGEAEFTTFLKGAGAAGFNGSFDKTMTNGILSRGDDKNPVKDWNFIYVPYCTGDVHGGANPAGMVPGVAGTQMFVGRKNLDLDLAAVKALLPNTSEVLLSGMSGGGFGTIVSYDQVATFWGAVPVNMIDDSGPPMSTSGPWLASCLLQQLVSLWGLDKGVLQDCGADCQVDGGGADNGNFAIDVLKHIGKKYPNRTIGLIESTADVTITSFFGFGNNGACGGFAPVLEPDFTNGLLDLRAQMSFDKNFGSFYFGGADYQAHTSYEGSLDERTSTDKLDGGVGPTALYTWTQQMITGTATNVGP